MKKRPASSDDDADDFARAMADFALTPVKADPRGRVHPTAPEVPTARVPTPRPAPLPVAKPVSDLDEAIDGGWVAPGADPRELKKLRRGDHAPVRRLDLHGLSAAAATAQLKLFIDGARATCRCVAVIHGRGLRSVDNVAILKPRVRDALRKHPAVLAFADAPRADGGDGAVYVLLRKN